ncbi:hypothetical protein D3C72_875750 [compost metagenome]
MPGNGLGRFQVRLEYGVVEIPSAYKAAGVHVDRGQRFGLVDDQVAARFQVHPARQRTRDLVVHIGGIKQRAFAAVMLDAVHHGWRVDACPFHHRRARRA